MQFPCVVALVECWTCKGYFTLSLLACMSGCSFLVWMSIMVTIYSDYSFLVKPCFIALFHHAWLHCACSICITSFLHTMIILCCCLSGDTCSQGSRALRNTVFKWESCKSSVWESVKKSSRLCTQQGTRKWISRLASRQRMHTSEEELNSHASWSTIGQKVHFGHSVSLRLGLATQSSREAKLPVHSVSEKLTLRILYTHQYKYPLYPWNVESFQREFWERNPGEKQDWLIHNFHPLILQISLLSPSPLLHP